jgi:hypothetical protein
MTFKQILKKKKYELLLFGLFQHLFMALILSSLEVYRNYFWPVNMIVLGLTSFGVYLEHNKQRRLILHILVLSICSTPLLSYFIGFSKEMLIFLSISYTLFFYLYFSRSFIVFNKTQLYQ